MINTVVALIVLLLVLIGRDTPYLNIVVPNWLWMIYYVLLFLLLFRITFTTIVCIVLFLFLFSYVSILYGLTQFAESAGVLLYVSFVILVILRMKSVIHKDR